MKKMLDASRKLLHHGACLLLASSIQQLTTSRGFTMTQGAKSFRYTITTLTPLHIGCGEFMTPVEYHLGDELIVPELERIFAKYPEVGDQFNDKLASKSGEELARTEMGKLLDPVVFEDREIRRYAVTPLHND